MVGQMGATDIARRTRILGGSLTSLRWRDSAAVRLAVLVACLLFGAMILLGGAAVSVTYAIMADRLDRSIERAADDLVALRARQGSAALVDAIREREGVESDSLDTALFDRGGRLIAGRLQHSPPLGWSDMMFPDSVEGEDPTRVFTLKLNSGERLMVAGNRRPLLVLRSAIGWLFLVSVVIITMLCTLVGLLLVRFFDRRLSPITRMADAVLEGDISRRVPERGKGDEFDHVARSLNLMLDRIAGLLGNLRQISSDLAHDLRTPLTRIRTGLEAATSLRPERASHAIMVAIDQIDDVVLMFDAILRIAEIEGGAGRNMVPLDLDAIAREIAEMMAPAFAEQHIDLIYRGADRCRIRADRLQIAAALINLLENVLRHAPGSESAEVIVARDGDRAILTVRDAGPGVPEAHLEHIFDRFVRLDRSRSTVGHGLGLSVVRSVAQAHGANLTAANVDGGLCVRLDFPAIAQGNFTNTG